MKPGVRYALYGAGILGSAALIAWAVSKGVEKAVTVVQDARGPDAWGGSQVVAERAIAAAVAAGGYVTSRKRDDTTTLLVGSTRGSDHHIGNLSAYAIDFGVQRTLAIGDRVFEAVRRVYGIPAQPGSYTRHTVVENGVPYSIQLLWRVKDHYDHVHLGVRRVETPSPALAGLRLTGASPMLGLL